MYKSISCLCKNKFKFLSFNQKSSNSINMNFIKNAFIYLLLVVFDVKTTINQVDMLESCVSKLDITLLNSNEDNANLLKLIDQSSVILKAFGSDNLINFVDVSDNNENVNIDDDPYVDSVGDSFAGNRGSGKSLNQLVMDAEDENYDSSDDSFYSDYYVYKSNDDKKLKTLMTFAPITVYKGVHILRQLELFNNQEYFQIKGQLNATLELDRQQRILYQRNCYSNSKINNQGQRINENHLIEKQIRSLVPGQLIIFAKLDKSNFQTMRNRLIVKTNGIVRWKPHVENFVWNNLGWSSWSEWSACSKSCRGIQQRYRQCLTNQQNHTAIIEKSTNKMNSFESAANVRQQSQQLCIGYNIEQRECNLFDCKDAVNLLSLTNSGNGSSHNGNIRTIVGKLSTNINQVVDKNDFTIMFTIRSKVNKHHLSEMINQHLVSLQSDTDIKLSKHLSLTISLIDNGIKVVQEKDSASEMFAIKLNLFDLHWHQIALSFRSDGLVTCYMDCTWDSTFVMAKGSFEVPQPDTRIVLNSKLNGLIEWKQLSLISGNHVRSQCSSERTPIYDNNKLFGRMFNDEAN